MNATDTNIFTELRIPTTIIRDVIDDILCAASFTKSTIIAQRKVAETTFDIIILVII